MPTLDIPYGRSSIRLDLDPGIAEWHVVQMDDAPPLADPRAVFMDSCRDPVACAPLSDCISPNDQVVVVTSDYQLQQATFRANVIRRSSRQFAGDLQDHTKRIAISPNCITMSHRIEDRLDQGAVDRLKELRDRLAGQGSDEQ